MSEEPKSMLDEEFRPGESSGLNALEQAYNSREVSLPMLVAGAVVVAALAGVLIALVLFSG